VIPPSENQHKRRHSSDSPWKIRPLHLERPRLFRPSRTLSVCEGGADFVYRRHYDTAASKAMRAAFSPIMIDGAFVLPDVKVGMIEASATRRPAIPWTRS
jgi:hypothetical protein